MSSLPFGLLRSRSGSKKITRVARLSSRTYIPVYSNRNGLPPGSILLALMLSMDARVPFMSIRIHRL